MCGLLVSFAALCLVKNEAYMCSVVVLQGSCFVSWLKEREIYICGIFVICNVVSPLWLKERIAKRIYLSGARFARLLFRFIGLTSEVYTCVAYLFRSTLSSFMA